MMQIEGMNDWQAFLQTTARPSQENQKTIVTIYDPHPKEIEHDITPFLRFFCFHPIHSISTLLLMVILATLISPDFC